MDQLSDRVWIAAGGTNVGIIRNDTGGCVLIDTGLNDSPARKYLRFIRDELDCEVRAIVTTHGHADHFGANAFVVKRTGAEVYAPDLDEAVLRHPVMQPMMLFGGADPSDSLRTSFLLADAGPVNGILQPGTQRIADIDVEIMPLGGHSMNQVGVIVDNVFFAADVVFPDAALEKYRIAYLYCLTDHLASLEKARGVACNYVVPGHGLIETDIERLADLNLSSINLALDAVRHAITQPQSGDQVASTVFNALGISINTPQAYYLLRPTIGAYLAHLERLGEADQTLVDGSLLWRRD